MQIRAVRTQRPPLPFLRCSVPSNQSPAGSEGEAGPRARDARTLGGARCARRCVIEGLVNILSRDRECPFSMLFVNRISVTPNRVSIHLSLKSAISELTCSSTQYWGAHAAHPAARAARTPPPTTAGRGRAHAPTLGCRLLYRCPTPCLTIQSCRIPKLRSRHLAFAEAAPCANGAPRHDSSKVVPEISASSAAPSCCEVGAAPLAARVRRPTLRALASQARNPPLPDSASVPGVRGEHRPLRCREA